MLGWFKRRKKKKQEAALLEEQKAQELKAAEHPVETPQDEIVDKEEKAIQEISPSEDNKISGATPISLDTDIAIGKEETVETEIPEVEPIEAEPLEDVDILTNKTITLEPEPEVSESFDTEISPPTVEEMDDFDDPEFLGESPVVFEVLEPDEPGPVDTVSLPEETPPVEQEISPSIQKSIEEPVSNEIISISDLDDAEPEEPAIVTEELSAEDDEVIEDVDFLEDFEILEETAQDSVPATEEKTEEEIPGTVAYEEAEELFKELLSDEETDLFDAPSDETEEVESPVAPDIELIAEPEDLPAEEEVYEQLPPVEPEFLEDVEIYEEPEVEEETPSTAPIEKPYDPNAASFFKRLADRLSKTRDSFINQMDLLFLGKKEIDADMLDDLEELLITADLGVNTTMDLIEHARKKIKRNELSDPSALKGLFKERLRSYILESDEPAELVMPDEGPFVVMVIGVNGVGKTTTIGKITHKFIQSDQSVLLAAADTFRAAAVSQLQIWGKRNNVEVVSGKAGIDPSSVAYDAMERAKEKDYDVVLVDTAGRLHTQSNLMEELKKIKRVMGKRLEGAPHEILLVLDATTGQNGVSQAKLFNEAVGVTGLALTKLDGTAKGGIVANVCKELKIPIRFIGIGEQLDDLRDFDPDEFIEALFQER